jgi:hypothetical protein
MGFSAEQVARVYQQIDAKRKATRYLHCQPILVEDVPGAAEISGRRSEVA